MEARLVKCYNPCLSYGGFAVFLQKIALQAAASLVLIPSILKKLILINLLVFSLIFMAD